MNDSMEFQIAVTKTATPKYQELQARYSWVCELWDEAKNEQELHPSIRSLKPEPGRHTVRLEHFGRVITSDQVIEWAGSKGYRVCAPYEREAFVHAFRDLLLTHWIVDLGTVVTDEHGTRHVPILCGHRLMPRVGRSAYDGPWGADGRFLLIRS